MLRISIGSLLDRRSFAATLACSACYIEMESRFDGEDIGTRPLAINNSCRCENVDRSSHVIELTGATTKREVC